MRLVFVLLLAAGPVFSAGDGYAALLGRVVKRDGVDYTILKKERRALDDFVRTLADASPGKARADRIAFWINAYNALTLQQVLDTKPDRGDYSVRKVKDFWTGRTWKVAGKKLTLDGIEKGILLKRFKEPRVHFAVNCASRSCPPLLGRLYAGKTLERDLARQTRAYLADRNENRFDLEAKRAEISKLFSWYASDFSDLQAFLARYAPSKELAASLRKGGWEIAFLSYDWSLNEAGKPRAARGRGVHPVWLAAYLLATLALLLYGFHAFKMLLWRRRNAGRYLDDLEKTRTSASLGRTAFPLVLVQVPVFNEPEVVEEAIEAVAGLDYPNLEIQILDDSNDATRALVDKAVAHHRARGVEIAVVRRTHRTGFKAGALAAGLERSEAAFIAIFDADFRPRSDFILRALPLFEKEEQVACVQGRWGHLNRTHNWLTRAQAVGVDAHFFIQQLGRASTGAFLNFNGTAGMWRRAAIADAGGWHGDTITEDLDLSYRAQLRGWKIVFDPSIEVPAELPPTLGAYKSQQRRWACGSIQCARRFLGPVWRSELPFWVKTEATMHLCGYVVCVAMFALILLLPYGVGHLPMISRYPGLWPLWIAIWTAAAGPLAVSFAGQKRRAKPALGEVALCFLLGLGSCANNSVAVLRGLMRPIRTFVRTPKQGTRKLPLSAPAPRMEIGMTLFTLAVVVMLAETRPWAIATYALFCSAGFCFLAGYWWIVERPRRAA